ncbi:MAG TPA: hypothetical protein VGA37_14565 [Gemmatimonadales bacterium]
MGVVATRLPDRLVPHVRADFSDVSDTELYQARLGRMRFLGVTDAGSLGRAESS